MAAAGAATAWELQLPPPLGLRRKMYKTYKVNRRRPKVHSPSVEEEAGGSAAFALAWPAQLTPGRTTAFRLAEAPPSGGGCSPGTGPCRDNPNPELLNPKTLKPKPELLNPKTSKQNQELSVYDLPVYDLPVLNLPV